MQDLIKKLTEEGYIIDRVRFGDDYKILMFNCIGDLKGSFFCNENNKEIYNCELTGEIWSIKKLIKILEEFENEE